STLNAPNSSAPNVTGKSSQTISPSELPKEKSKLISLIGSSKRLTPNKSNCDWPASSSTSITYILKSFAAPCLGFSSMKLSNSVYNGLSSIVYPSSSSTFVSWSVNGSFSLLEPPLNSKLQPEINNSAKPLNNKNFFIHSVPFLLFSYNTNYIL